MKRLCLAIGALSVAASATANNCGLPLAAGAGSATMTSSSANLTVTAGLVAGTGQGGNLVLATGFQTTSMGAYDCFMSTDIPLAVAALPGTLSIQRLVPTVSRTMTLEWTPSESINPVTYTVYVGTNPIALSASGSGLFSTQEPLANLSYTPAVYYWNVAAADQFGRQAVSELYTFSIVPPTTHLIAAPNPMHPGHGPTTFLFNMSGPGDAEMEIFSLPDGRRVYRQDYPGLQDGANTIAYNGNENNGMWLPNGVYTVRLHENGAYGHAVEQFKLISAR